MGLFLRFCRLDSVHSNILDAARRCLPEWLRMRCPKDETLVFAGIVWVRLCNPGFKLRSFAGPQDDPRLRLRVDFGSFM